MLCHFEGLWLHFSFCLHICIVDLTLTFVHLDFNIVTLERQKQEGQVKLLVIAGCLVLEGVSRPQNLFFLLSEMQTGHLCSQVTKLEQGLLMNRSHIAFNISGKRELIGKKEWPWWDEHLISAVVKVLLWSPEEE